MEQKKKKKMEIKLIRKEFTEESTIGDLFINGTFFCYTLEDKDRKLETGGKKIHSLTAIPRGKYKIVVNFSNRFKQMMPLLLNVPQFQGIRIHTGNKASHSEGCILLGKTKAKNFVGMSRDAYASFMTKINKANKIETITIEII